MQTFTEMIDGRKSESPSFHPFLTNRTVKKQKQDNNNNAGNTFLRGTAAFLRVRAVNALVKVLLIAPCAIFFGDNERRHHRRHYLTLS